MRVISGAAKGRRLKAVPGLRTRPTADRVRQAIFDILGDCEDLRVLDLFAGTGAMGIEALSRGAADATFVERDRGAAKVIGENLVVTRLGDRAEIRATDAEAFLESSPEQPFDPRPYDLVFVDPPYERGLAFVAHVLGKLGAGDWVVPGGTVVAEAATGRLDLPPSFRETRARQFGQTQVTIAVREDPGPP